MILEGTIQIPFKYAAGIASSRFLAALRDDMKILGSPCTACGTTFCPARSFCPTCGADLPDVVELATEGELTSWTEIAGKGLFALVKLDGAGTAILHRLLAEPAGLKTGIRVRARFARERQGSILDLEGFEPVAGGVA